MKYIKELLAVSTALAFMQTPANAAIAITNTSANFNPVEWHLTQDNGQYTIINATSRVQFVLVTLKYGAVGTFASTYDNENTPDCMATLSDATFQHSILCELKPNYFLNIDKDFSNEHDAKGTYQIEMSRNAA